MYILLISVHGLIRGQDLELGRDADTGGQTTYVVELARALARHPDVERVDLLTRLIDDPSVSADYSRSEESLGEGARILRVPCGPSSRYVRKELLWPYLDQMVDRCLHLLRREGLVPDVVHSHYADAGYVGLQLSQLLGIPQIHTGHSLGRAKRGRLLASGRKPQAIDRLFHFPQRIAVEEEVLRHASLVIAGTHHEIEEQYSLYEMQGSPRLAVIPPGIDTSRFQPANGSRTRRASLTLVDRFLSQPHKPMILTIGRPEASKNLMGIMHAFGADPELRELANLAIVAGQRDDVRELEQPQQSILRDLIMAVDAYDLWGSVALPKRHAASDIPALYRLAATRRGVYANPAIMELFGLALIEAAASGLPIVTTMNGGPRDIVGNCRNGLLVDPEDPSALGEALKEALGDRRQWQRWSRNGAVGVRRHYTWDAHVAKYLKAVQAILRREQKRRRRRMAADIRQDYPTMRFIRRVLISDIDDTLTGDAESLGELLAWLRRQAGYVGFGIATGRVLPSALAELSRWRIPVPDLLITSVGTEIHYGREFVADSGWAQHISYLWRRDALEDALGDVVGLRPQEPENQRRFKLSYYTDERFSPAAIPSLLNARRLRARVVQTAGGTLDVLPVRASKGHAVRYLAGKWNLPLNNVLVAGDSGNDVDMLKGDTLALVVANHTPDLEPLRKLEQIFFADSPHAAGILEGLEHYGLGRRQLSPPGLRVEPAA